MSSHQNPLHAVFFAALVLSLHVPAVAERPMLTTKFDNDFHLQRDTEKEEAHTENSFRPKIPADVVDIRNTSGHSDLSSVMDQTIKREIRQTFVQSKPVFNSLAMLSENLAKKENLTVVPMVAPVLHQANMAALQTPLEIQDEFSNNIQRMGLSLTNTAGAGKGIGVLAGAVIPAALAVTCTVVASAGAVAGALKAAAAYFKKKKENIAMEKCEVRHYQVTISLALIGLVGTGAAIAFPPLGILAAAVGAPAATLSIINRHKGRQALCRYFQRKLEKDIANTVKPDSPSGDLDTAIEQFDGDLVHDLSKAQDEAKVAAESEAAAESDAAQWQIGETPQLEPAEPVKESDLEKIPSLVASELSKFASTKNVELLDGAGDTETEPTVEELKVLDEEIKTWESQP